MHRLFPLILIFLGLLFGCGSDASTGNVNQIVDDTPITVDWVQETQQSPWEARDSAAEAVFNGQMWLMGGWFDSYLPTPRDIWSSYDGKQWQLVSAEAPWTHGDLASAVSFDDKLWLLGGWSGGRLDGASASNEVWSTDDGGTWRLRGNAPWAARLGMATVEFKGRLWVLGGVEQYYYGDTESLKNDVWATDDGVNWTLVLQNAPWNPRAFHTTLVFMDRLWIIGGGNYVPTYSSYNDVWSTADGVTWTQETSAAQWAPRIWFTSVVYRGCMWVLGGWSLENDTNWRDSWYSRDGRNWTQLVTPNNWSGRHEHSSFVFDDKIWVVGGNARPLSNDAWSLRLPASWKGAN